MAIINQDKGETFPDDNVLPTKGLYSSLKKLFSTDVVVRNIGNKQLKIVDSDSIFRGSDKSSLRDRFNRVRSSTALSNRDMNMSYQAARLELFRDYDVMDSDPIIASALDIFSDESTTLNEFGEILNIQSDDENIKQILTNLFYDILNLEFNLWSWTRNLVKYGDFFLKLEISPEYGVYGVTPLSAYEVNRIENFDPNNPNAIKFQHEGAYAGGEYENYEMAHFRLVGDANFLPYGKAQIEGARRVWKQIMLMIDAMLIHRVMRAPEKRIFKIDIGNIPPSDVDAYMEKVMAKIKKVPYIDERTGDYNLRFNLQNMIEDFYLPVRGGDSGTSIDTLQGMEFTGIEDIDFLSNRMMAALRIPRQFLGFDDAMGGRATLSAQDVRFSRTITRIQQVLVSELTKIATIHLFVQGYQDASMVNFKLSLTNPSTIQEQEKIALWADKIALAKDMLDSKQMSRRWINENIFNLSDADARKIQKEIVEDTKQMWRLAQIETEGNDPMVSGVKVKEGESESSDMDFGGSFAGGSSDNDGGDEFGDSMGDDAGGDNDSGGEDSGSSDSGGDSGGRAGLSEAEDAHHGAADPEQETEQRKKDADVKRKELRKRGGVEDVLGKLDANKAAGPRKPQGFQTNLFNDLKGLQEKLKLDVPKSTLLSEADIVDFVETAKSSFMDERNIHEE